MPISCICHEAVRSNKQQLFTFSVTAFFIDIIIRKYSIFLKSACVKFISELWLEICF